MPIQDRNTLKSYFRKGQMPTEGNFQDLIDSGVNKVDDGISKNVEDGLMLSASGSSEKLISFYKNIQDKSAVWSINIDKGSSKLQFSNYLSDVVLTFTQDGNIGINVEEPEHQLEVDGVVGMKGQIGIYKTGKIPADGTWYPILEELNGCHLFDVVAGVGKKKSGQYCLVNARIASTYGNSKSRIHLIRARYGAWRNRIQFRFTGTTYDYKLEMRTRKTYEGEFQIQYYITQLWFDHYMDNSL